MPKKSHSRKQQENICIHHLTSLVSFDAFQNGRTDEPMREHGNMRTCQESSRAETTPKKHDSVVPCRPRRSTWGNRRPDGRTASSLGFHAPPVVSRLFRCISVNLQEPCQNSGEPTGFLGRTVACFGLRENRRTAVWTANNSYAKKLQGHP